MTWIIPLAVALLIQVVAFAVLHAARAARDAYEWSDDAEIDRYIAEMRAVARGGRAARRSHIIDRMGFGGRRVKLMRIATSNPEEGGPVPLVAGRDWDELALQRWRERALLAEVASNWSGSTITAATRATASATSASNATTSAIAAATYQSAPLLVPLVPKRR